MKLSSLLRINAILYVVTGIAFALYGPLMMAFFGILDTEGSAVIYWYAASFARMFGGALFGFGFLLWAVSGGLAGKQFPEETRRNTVLALILSNFIALIIALTQQTSIWGTLAGWIMVVVFLALLGGYALTLIRNTWD
ncbi:MAG TPA: hypothetical protein VLA49_00610 [Anaerolineales bacterium]|nr:hypothetical protein [Anaerolineales bacterium]